MTIDIFCATEAWSYCWELLFVVTVQPANSDSDVMFCLQSNQGIIIDRSRVY